jgi:choline dehydrogenase-like flavoprotein
MLLDITECDGTRLRADLCLIGCGAAGITLARELAGGPLSVVVLEGGGTRIEESSQELNECEVVGLAHDGTSSGRIRVFGGASKCWAGQALPLLDIDFARRNWVPHSGWPITRAELEPYYVRAFRLLDLRPFLPEASGGEHSRLSYSPRFSPDLMISFASSFSKRPDFAAEHRDALNKARNVRIVLHANVTELRPDGAGSTVVTAHARSLDGRTVVVEADTFVVCAGAIESPRLLLSSDRSVDGGLGNSQDLVGRYFQDHPGLTIGTVAPVDRKRTHSTFRTRRVRGIRYQPLFSASEDLQRREKLLNVGGSVLFDTSERNETVNAGKAIFTALRERRFGSDERAAFRAVIRRPGPLVAAAGRYFVMRQPALDTSGPARLTLSGEQAPNPESRVYLSNERDALGMRRVVLDWRLTPLELSTWRRFAVVAASELERTGFGRVNLDAFELPEDPGELSGRVIDNLHHIGTARMAADPSEGVVDHNCRVFGMTNLYVASSAVFPTGGFSNPTLTIIALAIRLADHLRSLDGRASR